VTNKKNISDTFKESGTLIGKSRRIRLLREEKFPNKSGQQLLKEKK